MYTLFAVFLFMSGGVPTPAEYKLTFPALERCERFGEQLLKQHDAIIFRCEAQADG